MIRHLFGWALVVGMFGAIGYAAYCEFLIRAQDRRDLHNLERIETRPTPPPPPIHFTRDPSPRPRNRSAA